MGLEKLAEWKERDGAASGEYPPNWPQVALQVKEEAGWQCERCSVKHGGPPNVLTVHHLDGNKWNLERWNLAALCQRCHLRVQARITFLEPGPKRFMQLAGGELTVWDGVHSHWMALHVWWYNLWAIRNNRPQLPLSVVVPRSYEGEWR